MPASVGLALTTFGPVHHGMRSSLLVFIASLALCSWHLDAGFNANTVSRAAMVAAIVEQGTLRIDAYHALTDDKALVDGHYYSEKAPLPALLVTPFWWAFHRLGWVQPGPHGLLTPDLLRLGGFLCGSLPLALLITLLYARLRHRTQPFPAAWMALLPFAGSFLFVYSGSFHGHLIAALFLVCAWLLRRQGSHLASALAASAAVLSEYSLFVFPLAWVAQDAARGRWQAVGAQVFGGLPGLLALLLLNLLITGTPLKLPYAEVAAHVDRSGGSLGLGAPGLEAAWGLLFSSYRGLFTHAPATLLCAVLALIAMRRQGWRWTLFHPLVLPSIALVLLIAGHSMWWGGWAFGPRHLTSIAALLLIAALPRLPERPWADGALVWLTLWGVVVVVAAKCTTWYSLPTEARHPFREVIAPLVAARSFTESQWPVGAGFSPIMGTALFLLALIFALRLLKRADALA